jgi:hypothetical protein|tara:strand:+ start:7734 stop:7913 length:180 start_codon:yes stop_codon:yes gene_type:complete
MYLDNAIAIYRQRLAAVVDGDRYLAERLREKFQWACRQHCEQTGDEYIKTFYAAIDAAA